LSKISEVFYLVYKKRALHSQRSFFDENRSV